MNITSRSRYALKIMMDLAIMSQGELVKRTDIARRQGIPAKYLDQIMVLLRKSALVKSARGRDGGYLLGREPATVSVWDILVAVEDGLYPVLCVDETAEPCMYELECTTRDPWQLIFAGVKNQLSSLSLQSLTQKFGGQNQKKHAASGLVCECPQGRSTTRGGVPCR